MPRGIMRDAFHDALVMIKNELKTPQLYLYLCADRVIKRCKS